MQVFRRTMFGLVLLAACGSEGDVRSANVNVLVESPSSAQRVDYTVECLPDSVDLDREPIEGMYVVDEGTLELGSRLGLVSSWDATVDLMPGDCTVRLFVVDTDGEVACVSNESLQVGSDPQPDLHLEVMCPFGRIDSGPPPGDLILFAETVAKPEGAQSVAYAMTCRVSVLDAVFDISTDGSLDLVGTGEAEVGAEVVSTNEWKLRLEDLGAGPCTLVLSALDDDGTAICSIEERLEVVSNNVTHLHALLLCGG